MKTVYSLQLLVRLSHMFGFSMSLQKQTLIQKKSNLSGLFLLILFFAAFNANAQCPSPPGDQTTYGNDSWIGYLYAGLNTGNPPTNALATTYYGYVTQPEMFNQDMRAAALTGPNLCGSFTNQFAIRYKMRKNFTPGYYTVTVGGDDGYRLSINGGSSYIINNWVDHSYTTTTQVIYLDGLTSLILEYYEQGGDSQVSFSYIFCPGGTSTAPISIAGNVNVCNGSSTVLTATGGTEAPGTAYQWGTGNVVGNNPIAGETFASISVSPTVNTTYWVRRVDTALCANTTSGITQAVTVRNPSSGPTGISGTTTICSGISTTLTANGGYAAPASIYEWGTETVGTNIISGQTTATITVTPSSTTTYWVRRKDVSTSCNDYTTAATTSVIVNIPAGNQTDYGINSWIGYVYPAISTTNFPADAFTAPYKGYITQPEMFNQDISNGNLSSPNICGTYGERFAIRYKMQKTFAAGYYNFTIGGDDGVRLSLDGGATFPYGSYTDHSYTTYTSGSVYLNGPTALVLEYYENTGYSQVTFNYTTCNDYSTAPTAISGTTAICTGNSTTLTATGGYAAPNATYQWGTGATVGSGTVIGTSASITVNPTANTTYWVRRVDASPCNLTTSGITQTVTIVTRSTPITGLTSSSPAVCSGSSTTLTASGGTAAAGSYFEWGTGYTVGSNVIVGETGASIIVSPSVSTVYWARRIDAAPCNTVTASRNITIGVVTQSTDPTTISGSLCATSGGTTLTASGGTLGSNGTYQWGTGSVVGAGTIISQNTTYASVFVNPTTATTYWVRRVDTGACAGNTGGVFVRVSKASTAPTNTTVTATAICAGGSATITATGGTVGTDSNYEWGIGATIGDNPIGIQSSPSLTVTPTATTTYWVRRVDGAPCSTITGGITRTINVNINSVAPTSISAGKTSLCYSAGGTTLTPIGGSLGTSSNYQWGTGSVVGGGTILGTNNTLYINPTTTTTYWVRIFNGTLCNNYTDGAVLTVEVSSNATNPTSITGTNTICAGTATTLTQNGGALTTGAYYEWGTGSTIGSNPIGTGNSISVSPTVNTIYWVRAVNASPCTVYTYGPTRTVTVTNPSTAPTGITTSGTITCPGTSVTLTATGGSSATGATYQWGTGSIAGTNIIAGTGVSILVSPTATTTYWVRRKDNSTCTAYTDVATTSVSVASVAGNPTTFGNNMWNVYGYSTGDLTLASAVYSGYYSQTTLGFDTTASWGATYSPSSASNWTGCPISADNFTFVYKRQGFPCGTYTVTMANWDDASQLYIDGVLRWSSTAWSNVGPSVVVGTFALTATSTIEVRTREDFGDARAALILTNTTLAPTTPTTISGPISTCSGSPIVLTASGGTAGTSGVFQWGTDAIGTNIIAGETGASITVSPTTATIYWVRRIDSTCSSPTSGITKAVAITNTIAGTITTPATPICKNTRPNDITLSGQNGNVIKWQSANNAAFTSGVTDIASTATTLTGVTAGPVSATKYFRAVVQNGTCSIQYSNVVTVIVLETVTYTNGVWSGTPTAQTPVVITADITLNTNLNVCSCLISGNAVVTVAAGATISVEGNIEVEPTAEFIVENNGSIVQVDDNATDIGIVTVKRNTTPMKLYDYTYWSAPVRGWTLKQLSPLTMRDKYHSYNPIINNWVNILDGAQVMAPARGYIVRSPQGWSLTNATSGVFQGVFTGIPNTGIIPATIEKGAGVLNLIGNPYPSAIDIDQFLLDPANANIVNGTIYLWTHNTAISSATAGTGTYNYLRDDYAKYNITGGIKTASAGTGAVTPTGKIASGQAFFIEAKASLPNGSYTTNFRNGMRVANNNNQFFRLNPAAAVEKNRIWVRLTNTSGAYGETLLGYVQGATNELDNLYDGKVLNAGNVVTLYSLLDTDKLAIQGKALPFDSSEIVPLGYNATIAGDFSIGLENFDGVFGEQNIYLFDKSDNTYHNLKTGDFNFTTAIGTFDTRFELRFIDTTLGLDNPVVSENNIAIIKTGKHIAVRSGNYTMESIEIFDLTGKQIYKQKDINANAFSTVDFNCAAQVLLVKVTLEDKQVNTKKVIMN